MWARDCDKTTRMTGRAEFVVLHEFPKAEVETRWRECLTHVKFPAHYDSPEFFLEPYWVGRRPFAVLAINDGGINGVLTGCHDGSHVVSGLESRPQLCVADRGSPEVTLNLLLQGLLKESAVASQITVYSWSGTPLQPFSDHGFRHRLLEGNVVLDLSIGAENVFKQFSESRRRNIRLAIKNNVEVFQGSSNEHYLAFYDVYLRWRRTERKIVGTPEVPFETFKQAFQLSRNRRLFLARVSEKIVAGTTLRFFPKGLLESAANASLDECLEFRPNDLLSWRTVEWRCQEGFPRYSLCGAHPFHRRCGGTVSPVLRYRADLTSLKTHMVREDISDFGRRVFRKLPLSLQKSRFEIGSERHRLSRKYVWVASGRRAMLGCLGV
jgi:hypothetical protein